MKIKNIILYFIGVIAFSSCQDMFEPADVNNRQEDAMVQESAYAHGLLMYGYGRLPYITFTTTDVATDDAVSNQKYDAYRIMTDGSWTSSDNVVSRWNSCKDGIQYVNLFLTKVDLVQWAPSAASKQRMFIDRLKGEAFGLRAILYYFLLEAHSGYADDGVLYGVPLLTKPEDGSSDFNQPRATFAECVRQCFADCDSAIALLPADYADISDKSQIPSKYSRLGAEISGYNLVFGEKSKNRISAKIAEAVKAQIALLAASPAYRDQSGVTSAEAAALCANVLKRIGGLDGFDKTGNIWYKNKTGIEGKAEMPEILWREDKLKSTSDEAYNFPPSIYGRGEVNPTQNLVDAFPMRNGLPITDPASGYNPNDPYVNRDPRFADNIVYNGLVMRKSQIITGTYPNDKGETIDNLNSLDGYSTRTGYYMRKLLREDVSPLQSSLISQEHIYPRIRYTEMFLAYAEAANDAWGPKADPTGVGFTAYDVIKAIRKRAGLGTNEIGQELAAGDVYLEDCANDQAKMTDLIRNERRIELCFENKRFWDLRRWKLPLNEAAKGMQIDRNEETGALSYTVIHVEDRVFDNSYQCYGPIPRQEVLKWSNLKQNVGWQ